MQECGPTGRPGRQTHAKRRNSHASGDHCASGLQQTVPPEGEYSQECQYYDGLYNVRVESLSAAERCTVGAIVRKKEDRNGAVRMGGVPEYKRLGMDVAVVNR